jgi:DNA mismatch endonuclease (patch repair protein)
MDVFSQEKRSQVMSKIKDKDTKPEKIIRTMLHNMGYRFRLHRRDMPGNPDIVLPKYKKVIFVHGCFWHGHKGCARAKRPSSNENFWSEKLAKNMERDKKNQKELIKLGWNYLIIWQCQIKKVNSEKIAQRISMYLKSN